jgi:ribonuclease Z
MRPTLHPTLVNGRFGDPALSVERLHERSAFLFDLGDLHALSPRDLLRVDHVFVSHMHMDHFIGFDALLRVHVGRAGRITMVGPAGLAAAVGHKLAAYTWDLVGSYTDDLQFVVMELHGEFVRETAFRLKTRFAAEEQGERAIAKGRVIEREDFTLDACVLEHHGASVGYALSEPIHVNVWGNKVEERGLILGAWLKPLKQAVRDGRGDDWLVDLPDGGQAPLASLRDLVSVEPGQKLGYVTDVRDTAANRAAIAHLCQGADLLFIEACFAAADRDKADARAHLTTSAAGQIGRMANARRLEPFHFSPRYEGMEAQMMAEVAAAFEGG